MSPELMYLAASAGLILALAMAQVTAIVFFGQGLVAGVGNRDGEDAPTGFAGRLDRTMRNNIEAMAMAAPLFLIAAVSNISSDMTILAAQLYFFGRVAHAGLYLAGIPWLRSAAWMISVAGLALIGFALFSA